MRLQRGKLALRRILAGELREDAAAYGLPVALDERWERTWIWCWKCGQERLQGRMTGNRTLPEVLPATG